MSQTEQQDEKTTAPPQANDAAQESEQTEKDGTPDPQTILRVEAILMTTDRPAPASKIADWLGDTSTRQVSQAIESLNEVYTSAGRSFRVERLAGGYQILTLPEYADTLARLKKTRDQGKLTPAALETLAIIAYKQPVLRVDIEAVRGVASGEVIRSLMERHLVKIVGRAEEIGRPMLYGTTRAFLEVFGLASLKDLPKVEDFSKLQA